MGGKRLAPESERVCRTCGQSGLKFYKGRGECQQCLQARNRKWVSNNRKKYLAYQKAYREPGGDGYLPRIERRNVLKKILLESKLDKPCMDCGQVFHPACMEYDHREPHKKHRDVSYLAAAGWSEETLRNEIAKCDLVCANCHRMRSVKAGVYPRWYGEDS